MGFGQTENEASVKHCTSYPWFQHLAHHYLEANLFYIVCPRPAWAAQRNLVSNRKRLPALFIDKESCSSQNWRAKKATNIHSLQNVQNETNSLQEKKRCGWSGHAQLTPAGLHSAKNSGPHLSSATQGSTCEMDLFLQCSSVGKLRFPGLLEDYCLIIWPYHIILFKSFT